MQTRMRTHGVSEQVSAVDPRASGSRRGSGAEFSSFGTLPHTTLMNYCSARAISG